MKVLNNFKLAGISVLIIVGLAACDKQGATATAASKTTVTAQENQAVAKPTQVFRFIYNEQGMQVYIDAKSVQHTQDGSDLNSGFILMNYDSPKQLGPNKSYQSELHVIVANCKQNLMASTNHYLFAGPNLTGETIGQTDKPSDLLSPSPGTVGEHFISALCLSEPDLERRLDKIQQAVPGYPPIQAAYRKE